MTNAETILSLLDDRLTSTVDLTLYGRAALHLGFPQPHEEHALSNARIPDSPEIQEQFVLASRKLIKACESQTAKSE